jgi:F-type H+-transporting ATPase subunit epsilon
MAAGWAPPPTRETDLVTSIEGSSPAENVSAPSEASGSFGILAGREPLVTVLSWGACRYRTRDEAAHYLAVPGGALFFRNGVLRIVTPRCVLGDDYAEILNTLDTRMRAETEEKGEVRRMLRELDRELLSRLTAM